MKGNMGCPTIPYKQIALVYRNKELEHFRLFRVNRFAVLSYMFGKNDPAQFTSDFKTRHKKHLLSFWLKQPCMVLCPTTRQNPVVGYWVYLLLG